MDWKRLTEDGIAQKFQSLVAARQTVRIVGRVTESLQQVATIAEFVVDPLLERLVTGQQIVQNLIRVGWLWYNRRRNDSAEAGRSLSRIRNLHSQTFHQLESSADAGRSQISADQSFNSVGHWFVRNLLPYSRIVLLALLVLILFSVKLIQILKKYIKVGHHLIHRIQSNVSGRNPVLGRIQLNGRHEMRQTDTLTQTMKILIGYPLGSQFG